ncbi:MAG: hypothetical protein SAJ37_19800, partial [Oscillatoria sp. PMC 1068.18]|nr:hypothetical protein [Oscillatoria sp. PMC 1068.18]
EDSNYTIINNQLKVFDKASESPSLTEDTNLDNSENKQQFILDNLADHQPQKELNLLLDNQANNPKKILADSLLTQNIDLNISGNKQQFSGDKLAISQLLNKQKPSPNPQSTITNTQQHKIWLGLTEKTVSLRAYLTLNSIWSMVTRTAFTQLNYSLFLLLGTVIGMTLIYLVPPLGVIWGIITKNELVTIIAFLTWLLMSLAYFPTIRFYRLSLLWAFSLPIIAFLYTMMTIDSALRYWQGRGGGWKGRIYPQIK